MRYRTLWVVRHVMPDDRLVHAKMEPEDEHAVIALALRNGKIHPDLAYAMAEFSKAFAQTGLYEVDPGRTTEVPDLQVWFEGVGEHLMGGLPMRPHYGGVGPHFFTILVDKRMVEPALLREMNEEVMPMVCGILVPTSYATPEA